MDDLLNPAILPKLWGDAAVEAPAQHNHMVVGQVMEDPHSKATVAAGVGKDGRALAHAAPNLKEDKEAARLKE